MPRTPPKSSPSTKSKGASAPETDVFYPQGGASHSNVGFDEAPQAEFEGAPITSVSLEGGVEDWARALEEEAAREARTEETRKIRSEAGKHRRKASGQ
ncbi:MAG: hypothetical protein AAFU56_11880, partial [Pseudomonadota bacterium]